MIFTADTSKPKKKMKTAEIVSDLRQKVTRGEIKPGEKLPTRQNLLDYYGISLGAFQKCINCLINEGFLESRGMKGTMVREYPPHQYRFALAIPSESNISGNEWDSFWRALLQVIRQFVEKDERYSYSVYYVGNEDSQDLSNWQELIEDAEKGIIAGAIVLTEPPIRVSERLKSIPVIRPNYHEFANKNEFLMEFDYNKLFDESLKILKQKKCSKIAILTNAAINTDFFAHMNGRLKQTDFYCPQEWIHGVALTPIAMPWVSRIVRLLFNKSQKERPEALLVLNENLLPHILPALSELGIIPGEGVKIISHCNLPRQNAMIRGIDYIGFDAGNVIKDSLKIFKNYRSNKGKIKQLRWIEPVIINNQTGGL